MSSRNTHKAQSSLLIPHIVTAVKLERARSAQLPLSPRAATVTAVAFAKSATLPRTSSDPFPSKGAQHVSATGVCSSLTPTYTANATTAAAAQAFADVVVTAPRIAVSDTSATSAATAVSNPRQLGRRSDSLLTEGMSRLFIWYTVLE